VLDSQVPSACRRCVVVGFQLAPVRLVVESPVGTLVGVAVEVSCGTSGEGFPVGMGVGAGEIWAFRVL
jgi:hypothetical protein